MNKRKKVKAKKIESQDPNIKYLNKKLLPYIDKNDNIYI